MGDVVPVKFQLCEICEIVPGLVVQLLNVIVIQISEIIAIQLYTYKKNKQV